MTNQPANTLTYYLNPKWTNNEYTLLEMFIVNNDVNKNMAKQHLKTFKNLAFYYDQYVYGLKQRFDISFAITPMGLRDVFAHTDNITFGAIARFFIQELSNSNNEDIKALAHELYTLHNINLIKAQTQAWEQSNKKDGIEPENKQPKDLRAYDTISIEVVPATPLPSTTKQKDTIQTIKMPK